MSAEQDGVFVIVRGEDRILGITIFDEDGNCVDLGTITAVKVILPGEDAPVEFTGGEVDITDANKGQLNVTISAAKSALLALVNLGDFETRVTAGGETRFYQAINALTVEETLFPSVA